MIAPITTRTTPIGLLVLVVAIPAIAVIAPPARPKRPAFFFPDLLGIFAGPFGKEERVR